MKVIAYSVREFEKKYLVKANDKKHDITFIASSLNADTAKYAKGKNAVLVFVNDEVTETVLKQLENLGVNLVITRSAGTDHIDKNAAKKCGIQIFSAPTYSPEAVAEMAVALAFSLSRQIVLANQNSRLFNFSNEALMGFNFSGKTVGIIGLGKTGQVAARIFKGCGCKVLGFDLCAPEKPTEINGVSLSQLLGESDIISLHVPLTESTRHLIDAKSIGKMKTGVMLINTARGALLKTDEVLAAIETGKIGYLGMDVYEFEKNLFFENHENDDLKDELLKSLLNRPNVLVTPHQGYLTREAVTEISRQTIKHLDDYANIR